MKKLFSGEELVEAAGYPALANFIPGDPGKALVVFIPGAQHTARIAYGGHTDARTEDFLAQWLVAQGYNFLGLSYPIETRNPVMDKTYPDFTARAWGQQAADIAGRIIEQHHLTRRVIVLGWSMGGKIAQPVSEAMRDKQLELDFFVSLAATVPVTNAISMTKDITMTSGGYADRSDMYHGWYRQLQNNAADNQRPAIIPEDIYLNDYVGHIPINMQAYGLRYRDGSFVRDHWAAMEDARSYDYAGFPLVTMIMPNDVDDRQHALVDQGNWGFFITSKIWHGYIAGNGVDLSALPEERWQALIDLVRNAPHRLSMEIDGNHFFFVGESGARETARELRLLEHKVHGFKWELGNLLGIAC
jgi:thioesterase domain-containing protein